MKTYKKMNMSTRDEKGRFKKGVVSYRPIVENITKKVVCINATNNSKRRVVPFLYFYKTERVREF